jgi:hypothetical protein
MKADAIRYFFEDDVSELVGDDLPVRARERQTQPIDRA